jgi:hypothetical protein
VNKLLDDKKFLKALDDFEKKPKTLKGVPDVCATYKQVKPILAGVLPFLGFIPGVGPRIVNAISALMTGLDAFCPKV